MFKVSTNWKEQLRVSSKHVKSFIQRGPNGTARLFVYFGGAIGLVTLLIMVWNMRADLDCFISNEIQTAVEACPAAQALPELETRLRHCEQHIEGDLVSNTLIRTELSRIRTTLDEVLFRLP